MAVRRRGRRSIFLRNSMRDLGNRAGVPAQWSARLARSTARGNRNAATRTALPGSPQRTYQRTDTAQQARLENRLITANRATGCHFFNHVARGPVGAKGRVADAAVSEI